MLLPGNPNFALPDHAARDLGCLDDHVARGSSLLCWIRLSWIRSASRRWRHEFWTDRIGDMLA